MKNLIALALFMPMYVWAGPYMEMGMDYDPDPAVRSHTHTHNGEIIESTQTEASNYVGVISTGWEWQLNGVMSDADNLSARLKLFEHRSDIMHDGGQDIVNQNEIRGLSVKYSFW